tara:strand:- start:603 stop:770 length:168 start_codon:yes stop_codon:yes gene_type:complete
LTDFYTCGNCKKKISYDDDFPALSRKDNKTHLCTPCGNSEASAEYAKMTGVDISW